MRAGRRTPLAAASAAVGVACAVSPVLSWLTGGGRQGHCGWTCDVHTTRPVTVVSLGGRGGMQVAPILSVLLIVVALLAAVALGASMRSASEAPVLLGWVVTAAGFASLVGTVVVIVRYAEGGTLIHTPGGGAFSANAGVGAVLALVGAAGAVLLGGAIALRAGAPGRAADGGAEHDAPGSRGTTGAPKDGAPGAGGGSAADDGPPTDPARHGDHAVVGAGYDSSSRS